MQETTTLAVIIDDKAELLNTNSDNMLWCEANDKNCEIKFNDVSGKMNENFAFYSEFEDREISSIKYGRQGFKTPEFLADNMVKNIEDCHFAIVMFDTNLAKALCKKRNGDCSRIVFVSDKCIQKGAYLHHLGYNPRMFNIADAYNSSVFFDNVIKTVIKVKDVIDNQIDYLMDNNDDKIQIEEVLVSNPPYNHELDIKILNEILPLFDQAIVVHPAPYLLSNKKGTKLHKFQKRFWNKINSADLFNGNKMFGIKLSSLFTTTYFDMHKKNPEIYVKMEKIDGSTESYIARSIDEINWMGKSFSTLKMTEIFDRVNAVIGRRGSVYSHCASKDEITDYSVKIGRFGGSTDDTGIKQDFFSMICKDASKNMIGKDYANTEDGIEDFNMNPTMVWSFESEKERENFILYMKSKVARFFLSYYKMNKNLAGGAEISIIPWMDFKHAWCDENLIEYFGITGKQWEAIDAFIPDYYKDYNYFLPR